MAKANTLESDGVQRLARLIDESTRASKEGAKYFLEPTPGVLGKAKSRRHHIIFGRRGSGKSSLLHKMASDLTVDRAPIAYVDLESFKGHSYPDVLLSILLRSFVEMKRWLDTAALYPKTKKSFWDRLFGSVPVKGGFNRAKTKELSGKFDEIIKELEKLLHAAEEVKSKDTIKSETSGEMKASGTAGVDVPKLGSAKIESTISTKSAANNERQLEYVSKKIEALHRNIMRYQALFRELQELASGPSYLLLDDLYHIRFSDQAEVIDYFHRIAKGSDLWLKIGTIRHRSRWYVFGDPSKGMKLGDDADEIDLDVTLEKFELTRAFLMKILFQLAKQSDVTVSDLLADGARDRLILACGGVARDFLTILGRSIEIAKERLLRGDVSRGEKVGVEDVNVAAGALGDFKEEDFSRDTGADDKERLQSAFIKITQFCTEESQANCILVEKDIDRSSREEIEELVDLKWLHRVKSRVTVRDRVGKLYDAFMLDLSRYTGSRARRNFELVKFWGANSADALRKASLIYLDR